MSQGVDREVNLSGETGLAPEESRRQSLRAPLLAKIESATVRVGIIGLGYVGLPLARAFSDRGIAVLGFDVDPAKVARLDRGESYIGHIADATIREMRENRFEATVDFQRLDEPDVIIICVPTPLTDAREPDLTYIVNSAAGHRRAAAARPARGARKHHLSGHDPRGRPPRCSRPRGWNPASTSSWPSVPSARIRAILSSRPPPFPRSSGASTRPASSWRSRFTARWSSGSCPSPARKSPRPARSSKTPIAPSTSRWSTS